MCSDTQVEVGSSHEDDGIEVGRGPKNDLTVRRSRVVMPRMMKLSGRGNDLSPGR